jgi:hypothetical protein
MTATTSTAAPPRRRRISANRPTAPRPRTPFHADDVVVRRQPTLDTLRSLDKEQVSMSELASAASVVCSWCEMSEFEAVCADCCLLRCLGGLLRSRR